MSEASSRRGRHAVLAATEPARTLVSAGTLVAALPWLRSAPRGEAHPVLVLPGLMASDLSTRGLRLFLSRLGHPVFGWALGRNRGPTQEVQDELPRLVQRLVAEHGTPVSIVGWSLGGIYARRLAMRTPRQIRQVISLGSPLSLSGRRADDRPGDRRPLARPLPVPSTAVYSRSDGIVDWRACRQEPGPISENVAVRSSHLGMGHDPAVLWLVADRLAQPRDGWRPFRRPTGVAGALFPDDEP